MTLGHLRASLNRFSRDLDDSEIILTFMKDEKQDYQLMAFCGYSNIIPDKPTVILGSDEVARFMAKNNSLKFADGSTPEDRGIDMT